jgi:hypothetical protein
VASVRPPAIAALLALLALAVLVAGAKIGAAWVQQPTAATSSASAKANAYAFDGRPGVSNISNAARAAIAWRGGSVPASTGEPVTVFVSDGLPAETPEKWAEFLVKLTHGPELARLTTRIATLNEVRQLCGAGALGCYSRNEMVSLGELLEGSATPEEVVRHEYGHHIAFHRANPPWLALDWGPKHWATTANVCARDARGEVHPGDGRRNYHLNPGEAWAETYRMMDERKVGITTAKWQIVDSSFFPTEPALQAAERDVLQPWTQNQRVVHRRVFGKNTKRAWLIPMQTPLDGQLTLSATLPRNGLHEVALVSSNRRTVLRRAQWTGQRVKSTATTICGQRSFFVRVTPSGGPGRVTVTVSTP